MSINKQELFNKCLDEVNEQIEKYQGKLDDISGKNEDFKINPDFDEYGNKGESLTQYEKYAGFLDNAQKMKEKLANLDRNHFSETIKEGSVVETKKHYYYVAAPLGEIEMEDGSQVFAISTDAPIYSEMEGKRKGEKFSFKNEEHEIVNVL
ncbi:MAG TPA: transcription elongation factor [Salinimicrobium sp.]|nr:transcription elongation factor [Salinimicrobium sp.]